MTKKVPLSDNLTGRNGKKVATIFVNGEEVRPRDTVFVVWNPDGVPVGSVAGSVNFMDKLDAGARAYWAGPTGAILALIAGYKITLHTARDYAANIASRVVYEDGTN